MPRHSVCQPGKPSRLRFICPPKRPTAKMTSPVVASCRSVAAAKTCSSSGSRPLLSAGACGSTRACSLRASRRTATTLEAAALVALQVADGSKVRHRMHTRPTEFGRVFEQEVRARHLEADLDQGLVPGLQTLRRDLWPVKQGIGGFDIVAVQEELRDTAAGQASHAGGQGNGTLHAPPVAQRGSVEVLSCPSERGKRMERVAVHTAMMHRAPGRRCVNRHADRPAKPSCQITVFRNNLAVF